MELNHAKIYDYNNYVSLPPARRVHTGVRLAPFIFLLLSKRFILFLFTGFSLIFIKIVVVFVCYLAYCSIYLSR